MPARARKRVSSRALRRTRSSPVARPAAVAVVGPPRPIGSEPWFRAEGRAGVSWIPATPDCPVGRKTQLWPGARRASAWSWRSGSRVRRLPIMRWMLLLAPVGAAASSRDRAVGLVLSGSHSRPSVVPAYLTDRQRGRLQADAVAASTNSSRGCRSSPKRSQLRGGSGCKCDPGVEFGCPAWATVRVGSKANRGLTPNAIDSGEGVLRTKCRPRFLPSRIGLT